MRAILAVTFFMIKLGMGRVQTRPEGVFGDPDPTRAIFGGPEQDPSKIFLTRDPAWVYFGSYFPLNIIQI